MSGQVFWAVAFIVHFGVVAPIGTCLVMWKWPATRTLLNGLVWGQTLGAIWFYVFLLIFALGSLIIPPT